MNPVEYIVFGHGAVRHIADGNPKYSERGGTLCKMFYGSQSSNFKKIGLGDQEMGLRICRACLRSPAGKLLSLGID